MQEQRRVQGVSCVFMDTVNILGVIYYYYPVRKGQVMVGNYFNVVFKISRIVILVLLSIVMFDFISIYVSNQPKT